jgi:hypothetical protein
MITLSLVTDEILLKSLMYLGWNYAIRLKRSSLNYFLLAKNIGLNADLFPIFFLLLNFRIKSLK